MSSTTSPQANARASTAVRTYGNWRKPASPGLPGLGMIGSVIALVSVIAVIMTMMAGGWRPALVVLIITVIVVAPLWYRNRSGRNGWAALGARVSWLVGRKRKQNIFRASVVSAVAGDVGMQAAPVLGGLQDLRDGRQDEADPDGLLDGFTGDVEGGSAGQGRASRAARRRQQRRQRATAAAERRQAATAGITTLPGLLARSTAYDCVDAYGNHFAMLHVPATRHFSVVLRCDPEGSTLVDAFTTDVWVAKWGRWLAELAREPNLEAASATVETTPDPGNRLAREVDNLLSEEAPDLARAMLAEVTATYAIGSPQVHGRVALTFNGTRRLVEDRELFSGKKRRQARSMVMSPAEMAAQIGSRLPGLVQELAATGAGGGVRALTVSELAELVRVAYDPAVAADLDAAAAQGRDCGITWANAGPLAQVEDWGAMRHDSGTSITWQMTQAPRGAVQAQVLRALLEPIEGVARKRVTLLYRPHDPASAARIADADVRTAIGRANARRGENRASDTLALASARQTAQEEAAGAGLTRFALVCTATLTGEAASSHHGLDHVADRIDQAAGASRIALRRVYGGQSAAFAAALGIGVVLSKHLVLPDAFRDNL